MHRNGQLKLNVNGSASTYPQALNLVLANLDRRFGQGSVMKLGDAEHLRVLCYRAPLSLCRM